MSSTFLIKLFNPTVIHVDKVRNFAPAVIGLVSFNVQHNTLFGGIGFHAEGLEMLHIGFLGEQVVGYVQLHHC